MMTLTPKPTQPKGMNDLIEFLSFLNDRKEREKYLAEMIKATKEAEKAYKLVGKANEIETLHTSALKKDTEADQRLEELNQSTQEILDNAERQAQEITNQAQKEAEAITHKAIQTKEEADRLKTTASDMLSTAKEREKLANEMYQRANQKETALNKAQASLDKKLGILQQLEQA
jgi:hypothetical protein